MIWSKFQYLQIKIYAYELFITNEDIQTIV